ncbi:MAG: translation initiation factor IF-2 [Candidatus Cloacimonadia bacterium]
MGIRVHELAKELKISVTALKTHLKHLNVENVHHMGQLEDDVADKIRGMFRQEVDNLKRLEDDRKKYQEIKKQEKKQEQQAEKKRAVEEEAQKKVEEAKKAQPQFIEKPIAKVKEADIPVIEVEKKTAPKKKVEAAPEEKTKPKEKPAPKAEPQLEVERPVKKAEPKAEPVEKPKPPRRKVKEEKEDELPEATPLPSDKEPRKKGIKKKTEEKAPLDEKTKHLQAKLKHGKKGKKSTKFAPSEMEEAEISRAIKQTMTRHKRKRHRREEKVHSADEMEQQKITIREFTSVNELAKLMDITPAEIITAFFKIGKIVTINQRLDKDSLEMICDEFEFDVLFADEYGTDIIYEAVEKHKDAEDLPRPAIVTIMGHVDHGKTSILDYIRSANVIAGEAGGITQHIGAYQVEFNKQKITFIDTPGHEAFAAMRARGAQVTDIAIIVVAANDSVKPQTVEAIDHAKASGVEIIVAINKMDLETANLDRTIADLAKHNVFLEGYGGSVLWTPCSALTGEGIDTLLENILLAAEMKELTAKYDIPGSGYVIESQKDSRMGTLITVLMKDGTLEKGDVVVCGATFGRVRRIENERGKEMKKLGPSDVGVVHGLGDVPKAGDVINKVENERVARQISSERQQLRQERERYIGRTNLENLFSKIKQKEMTDLKLIVKTDMDGSLEAFCDSLEKISNEEVYVNIIHRGVGSIVEADVNLAIASDAIIIGFQVRADNRAKKLAEEQGVDIRIYNVIYDGINDVKLALEGLIEPEYQEIFSGSAVVKEAFRIRGVGVIAGCAVDKGVIHKDNIVKLFRDKGLVVQSRITSLKHFAEDIAEIRAGYECGIGLHNFNDIKEGDIIEAYRLEEIKPKL